LGGGKELGIKEIDLNDIKIYPKANQVIFTSKKGRYKPAKGKIIK